MENDELDPRTLKFGYTIVTKSPKDSDNYYPALYNPSYKTFCCYDESTIQIWDPLTGKTIYNTSTVIAAKSHKIVHLLFVKSHEVTVIIL